MWRNVRTWCGLKLGGRAGNEEDDQLEALNQEYEELRKQEEWVSDLFVPLLSHEKCSI